jgi:branched-chain amino acid transport system permease protein
MFVVLEGSIFPDMLFWVLSLEVFIMCLLGGWFTFFGPVVGAAIMVALRTFVGSVTEYWTMILGIVLILLIFFLPEGIMGINFREWARSRSRRAAARAAEGTDAAG